MLTAVLAAIPDRAYSWLLRRLGIEAGVHEWLASFCPCGGEHR